MQPTSPCPMPTCCWRTWASGPLLRWQLWLGAYSVDFFFPSQLCCPLRFQNSPQTCLWEGFLLYRNFSFTTPSPKRVSIPKSCLCFCLLYFVLSPIEEIGLPFWVPGVLHQCSEVVLWKLLNIQMIFWWICGGESGFPSYSSAILGLPSSSFFFPL